MVSGKESVEELKTMASALEELQLNLEPVRDKALDQKAFFTGYAQCAEQMLKVIVAKMEHLRNQANLRETGESAQEEESAEEIEVTPKEIKMEAPLIVEDKPKNGTRKRKPRKQKSEVQET